MQNNQMVLLKNLLRAGGQTNILRYEKDKKKRGKIIGNAVGMSTLYLMLAAYCILTCIGYGSIGMIDSVPVLCAVTIAAIEFIFTILKTNGYLFAFKEYDMLMSLPFTVKEIVQSKFLYMYVRNLPWIAVISLPMMIGYGIYTHSGPLTYILWIVLSALLPLIPMAIASAIGALIAAIGSGFKHKQIVQTILTFALVLLAFASRFIIEDLFKNDKVNETLTSLSNINDSVKAVYLPAAWFAEAISDHKITSILLFLGVTVLVYVLFYVVVSKFYRQINSRLMAHAAGKKYKVTKMKSQSVVKTVAFKEYRRLLSSTTYLTNMCVGELLVLIMSIAVLFVDTDKIIEVVLQGAPVTKEMLLPAIPMIVYFFIGMVATTAASYSLEGKNLWIVQSLPIERKTLFKGKMLFNMCLQVPFTLLGNLCLGIKFGASPLLLLLFLVLGFVFCCFSTTWGMRCDVRHGKFEWENEIEVVKQGASLTIYLLPNMFVSMALLVGTVALGLLVGPAIVTLILIAVYGLLAFLCYISIK